MDGHIAISKYRLNYFFLCHNIPVVSGDYLARGSFGAVFLGTAYGGRDNREEQPVVIKVALSNMGARHTLEHEAGVYRGLGMEHTLPTLVQPKDEDGCGVCLYYGSELVHVKDHLDWKNQGDAQKAQAIAHKRPEKCVEVEAAAAGRRSKRASEALTGMCKEVGGRCRACRHVCLQLHVLVLTQFGHSLRYIQKHATKKRVLSIPSVAKIMVVSLLKLEWLHSRGYVHRDLKPNNMVVPFKGGHPDYANVFLIDLGLSKAWRNDLGLHIEHRQGKRHTGTIYYVGTHAHAGHEASRRDDLQALAIIALDLLIGDLPWEKHQKAFRNARGDRSSGRKSVYKLKRQRDLRMLQEKEEYILHGGMDQDKLAKQLPAEFREFAKYTHSLAFTQEPDYAKWVHKFVQLIDRQHWIHVPVEWGVTGAEGKSASHNKKSASHPAPMSIEDTYKSTSSSSSSSPSVSDERHRTKKKRGTYGTGGGIGNGLMVNNGLLAAPPPPTYMAGLRDFQPKQWLERMCQWGNYAPGCQ